MLSSAQSLRQCCAIPPEDIAGHGPARGGAGRLCRTVGLPAVHHGSEDFHIGGAQLLGGRAAEI